MIFIFLYCFFILLEHGREFMQCNCSCLFMEGKFSNIFVCRGCFSSVVFSLLSPVLFAIHAIFYIVAFIVKALYLSVQAYCKIST